MTEAELLFTEVMNCECLSLYRDRSLCIDKQKARLISSALKRRINGEPIHYILGKIEFMGLEFKVNSDVFIPRQETEILVGTVIEIVSRLAGLPVSRFAGEPVSRFAGLPVCRFEILDIGTCSGCIVVSLAKFLPDVNITATDVSLVAIKAAKQNSIQNNVKVNFIESDLSNTHHLLPNTYHLIVSNPPYVKTEEINQLQSEIGYEPRIALDGGKDGLDFYRRIIEKAPCYLKEGGVLIMEMGFGQAGDIKNIFQESGRFEILEIVKDYSNIDRVIVARLQ